MHFNLCLWIEKPIYKFDINMIRKIKYIFKETLKLYFSHLSLILIDQKRNIGPHASLHMLFSYFHFLCFYVFKIEMIYRYK